MIPPPIAPYNPAYTATHQYYSDARQMEFTVRIMAYTATHQYHSDARQMEFTVRIMAYTATHQYYSDARQMEFTVRIMAYTATHQYYSDARQMEFTVRILSVLRGCKTEAIHGKEFFPGNYFLQILCQKRKKKLANIVSLTSSYGFALVIFLLSTNFPM
jgi:hypothetical protein